MRDKPSSTQPLAAPGLRGRRGALLAVASAGFGGLAAAAGPSKPSAVIRVASTFDDSGRERASGSGCQQGAVACFKAVNKLGGVLGAKIETTVLDDQFRPDLARANAKTFEDDPSVLAILHPVGTRQVAAVMETVQSMAIVGPNTGTIALRRIATPNVFWLRASYAAEVEKLVATAQTLGASSLALVHPKDPLGLSVLEAFTEALARRRLQPAVVATTPATSSLDVEAAARAVAKANPHMVLVGLAGTLPSFVKALRGLGCSARVYALSIAGSAGVIAELGEHARGFGFATVVPSPFSGKLEFTRRYQADMLASGLTEFSLQSMEGYLNATVLVEGLKRAGPNPTREGVMLALSKLTQFDVGGLRIGFGPTNREGNAFVDVAIVSADGRIVS